MEAIKIKQLIDKGESESLEFKTSLAELDRGIQELASMANTKGGMVLFGIKDDGEIIGVDVNQKALEKISNKVTYNIDPVIYTEIQTAELDRKKIILISIPKGENPPYLAFDKPYKRVGPATHKMKQTEYEKMLKSRKNISFEQEICHSATIEDIDSAKVNLFLNTAKAERSLSIDLDISVKEALNKLKLLKDDKLTNAAILLFGKDPQKFLLQARIRCARFKGVDFIDMKVIEGILSDQIKEAEKFVLSHIKKAAKIVMFERKEIWEYPPEAIREAIINAIAHRDYSSTGNIQIGIYDDRLEIWNPGDLPYPLTPDSLKKEHVSIPRNPLIANSLFLIKEIEQWGKGTNKIVEWLAKSGLEDPIFKEASGSFVVKFFAPKDILSLIPEQGKQNLKELGLNDRQIEMLRVMINEGKKLTIQDATAIFQVSRKTIIRDMKQLSDLKLIEKYGVKKGAYFIAKI